ncbi:putative transcription factor FAR family [Dioscorea sansibarensis]
MGKSRSGNNGCLTHRCRCPCGDDQCYIRAESDEEVAPMEGELNLPPGTSSSSFIQQGTQQAECTVSDSLPYVGQTFRTDDEAQEYYTNFARKNGFAIRRERSKGNPSHPLGVYKRELVCHRAGVSLPRKTPEVKRQRNKKSTRCKCEAQMIIKKNISKGVARWVVIHFSNEHNHPLLDSEEVRHLPAYRNISSTDRERILDLSKAGCTVNLIMRALEMQKGVRQGELSFTERDLRNFLQTSKNINRENEGSELLKACKAMKEQTPDFHYEFSVDENDKLEHVAWSYPDSIRAYRAFGDAVVFDTTYRLYAYDRPFGVWFGLDNYGNTIFFGCVLLREEKPLSFGWALQSFIRIMDGKFPQTMLTDLDMRLKEAMLSELPNTKHVFSPWNITSKLPSWFSTILGPRYDQFVSEFNRISNLENVMDFEQQWSQMVFEFGLASDRHIVTLSFHRVCWALPYLRGWFLGGLMKTGFSMSTKLFFKGFLDSQLRLKDFIEQVGLAVDLQNQAGEEAIMRESYHNVKIKTCMPMEEHASKVLTSHAFDMFQKEIVSSTQHAVYEQSGEGYLVRHRLDIDGGYRVQCIPSQEEIDCCCKEFETSGILCRHALRVLSLKNCFSLPDKYLLPRWRHESSLFPKRSGYKYWSRALRSLASIIVQESSLTKSRFDYVQWHMSKLLTHLRGMPTVDETTADLGPNLSFDATTTNEVISVETTSRPRGRPKKLKVSVEVEA